MLAEYAIRAGQAAWWYFVEDAAYSRVSADAESVDLGRIGDWLRQQFGGKLAIQADGNLVVYNPNLVPLWTTNTAL